MLRRVPSSRVEIIGNVAEIRGRISAAAARSGVAPYRVPFTAHLIASLEGLHLCGLMTVPPIAPSAEEARTWFARLRGLRDDLRRTHPDVLELSMGMSLDYEVAVEEGATMVRIGTALFGPRPT